MVRKEMCILIPSAHRVVNFEGILNEHATGVSEHTFLNQRLVSERF